VEAALDEELRACVEILTAEKIEAGLCPAEARRQALLETGGIASVTARALGGPGVLERGGPRGGRGRAARGADRFFWDLRHAMRMLRRHPLLTITSVVLIAVSVCLACSSFAVLEAIVLRKVPIPEPDRVVSIIEVKPQQFGNRGALTAGLVSQIRAR